MRINRNILLVGGFNKARSIANVLTKKGHSVTIINKTKADCMKLAELEDVEVIYGDGSRPFVLEDANAGDMDIVIALTKFEADNLVICEICKKQFGIKRAVALLQDIKKIDFFKKMGVDSVVCEIEVITQLIEQNVVAEAYANSIPLDNRDVSILEVLLPVEAPAAGKLIRELHMTKDAVICCIVRGNDSFIPRPDTQLYSGDKLILSCNERDRKAVAKELTGKRQ